ncbi:MAG TPA: NADH-quinone oxidoreductase subunit C [Candidatus Omnitrophota bacterium]|nr:NADH-quinone oxidoreductase subunit C [Candidatus Omnitrophota bacterium]HPS37256.1 NADH-quinone oxidoreductase subunit C [Candidatus Omnitrophota bacterium]
MPLPIEEVKKELSTRLPDVKLRVVRDSLLIENPADLTRVALFLKESPAFRMDYLSSVTGADYLDHLESVYHLYSMEKKHGPIALRVRVPKTNAKIPSLVPVYRGAEYQEREAYDTFGILYEGHPDLRRLFMWEGFEGFPLRKDYEQEDTETLETADVAWLEARGIAVPNGMKQKAEELKAAGKRAVAQKPEKPKN